MFRRLSNSLPKDPVFPTNLDQLGYFINERDQIRYKNKPELEFLFKINKNERTNEMQREAMNQCIRDILRDRFEKLGLKILRVPFSALPDEPHLPILTTPDIERTNRVILFFGEPVQDLGVFAYRTIGTESLHKGSIQDFLEKLQTGCANADIHRPMNKAVAMTESEGNDVREHPASGTSSETPGLLVANPGQLIWHCEGKKVLTSQSWECLPRKSAVHEAMRIDPIKNRIPGNENVDNHVAYMFDTVLPTLVLKDAQVDIIAMEWTGVSVVRYLNANWSKLAPMVTTLTLGAPQHTKTDTLDLEKGVPTAFTDFIGRRGRCYLVSPEPLDTPVSGSELFGMNCYSSGEEFYSERVIIEATNGIFRWLSLVHGVDGFQEIALAPDGLADNPEALMAYRLQFIA